jgi:hypothetical protein
MSEFPAFVVVGHGVAVAKGGRMFEPDGGRKDVFLQVEHGHSICTVTVPAEIAYSTYANGNRFRLVPISGDAERSEDI